MSDQNCTGMRFKAPPACSLIVTGALVFFIGSSFAGEFLLGDRADGPKAALDIRAGETLLLPGSPYVLAREDSEQSAIIKKLKETIIPVVAFRRANILDVLEFLADNFSIVIGSESGEAASEVPGAGRHKEPPPVRDGDRPAELSENEPDSIPPITLNLRRTSLYDVLNYVCDLTNLQWSVENSKIWVRPITVESYATLGMPAAIAHRQTDAGHVYTIRGIVPGALREDPEERRALFGTVRDMIGFCVSVDADEAKDSLYLTTTRPIDPVRTVDWLARMAGWIPTWNEMKARDEYGPASSPGLYRATEELTQRMRERDTAGQLTWYGPSAGAWTERQTMIAPIRYAPETVGLIHLNPVAADCMCHLRYALRLLTTDRKCLWENRDALRFFWRIAIADLNGDGVDEIIVRQFGHDGGGEGAFVIYQAGPPPGGPGLAPADEAPAAAGSSAGND